MPFLLYLSLSLPLSYLFRPLAIPFPPDYQSGVGGGAAFPLFEFQPIGAPSEGQDMKGVVLLQGLSSRDEMIPLKCGGQKETQASSATMKRESGAECQLALKC